MTDMPAWFNQLEWSPAIPLDSFITGKVSRKIISAYAGVYVVSPTEQSLRRGNALYVGKADGPQQSLRRRISIYLRRFGRIAGPASKHAGCELLFERYYKPREVVIYLRWAGCSAPRGVEGSLIQLLDPPCNNKEELADYDDDDLIPQDYLYSVNESYALK